MTSVAPQKVKSLRKAKAKMAELRDLPEAPSAPFQAEAVSQESSSESSSNSNFLQDQMTCPGLEKTETLVICSRPDSEPFKFSLKKVPSARGPDLPPVNKSTSGSTEASALEQVKKRIKPSNIESYFEDLSRFTQAEMVAFEQIYGETLFNNTITFSPLKQADIDLISKRKFKSYRKATFGEGLSKNSEGFRRVDEAIRAQLPPRLSKGVTGSVMLGLLRRMPSEKGLMTLLERDPEVILLYFQQLTEKDGLKKE